MRRATGHCATGAGTVLGGLALWRWTQEVELPVISLPKEGVVLMLLGGAEILLGLYRAVRRQNLSGGSRRGKDAAPCDPGDLASPA
ncbi:DUF5708 family protein [Streptomyces griseoincarnatus]